MKTLKRVLLPVAALSLLANMAFAAPLSSPREALSATSLTTVPATPLRYTVNYAASCDPTTEKGGTVIQIINRRPYTATLTQTAVRVKFYDRNGQLAGEASRYISSPSSGQNSNSVTIATSWEGDTGRALNSSLFPWIDSLAYNSQTASVIPCGYYGYAEIYSSHPAIQVSAFAVSSAGNVTELPVRKTKMATAGSH